MTPETPHPLFAGAPPAQRNKIVTAARRRGWFKNEIDPERA
jgi:hypothetical protein